MSSKTNELLNDIIQAASQAIVSDDEVVKRHVMADIVDAIASVMPTERTSLEGRDVPGATDRSANIRSMATPLCVIAKSHFLNRRFYAEAEWASTEGKNKAYGEGFVATVYQDMEDDVNEICRIEFAPRGHVAVNRMLRGLMRGVASHFGANARKRANRRAKEI